MPRPDVCCVTSGARRRVVKNGAIKKRMTGDPGYRTIEP
jgi:hypothetical protein